MDNYSKRRFYLNKREQNNSYPASINPDKNIHKLNNIKLYDESHNRRYLGINSNTSEVIDNIDAKNNYIRNRNDIGLNKLMNENKTNKYTFINYQNNKDINCLNSSSINNKNYLNRTNLNNNGKKYYDSLNKKSDYKTIKRNDDNLNNYIMSNYQKYNDNDSKYNDPKYKLKKTFINNYNYTKLFNQSYDYSQYKLFKNNIKEEKRYPVIVIQKKNTYISPNPNFSNYNKYSNRKKIIKIQSNWRGYFLRKIAVGSIKKYIGFVALMKYFEKIMDSNLRYLFLYVINLLKKYVEELKIRNKYRKINNNEINTNRRRYRQFRNSPDINGTKNLKEYKENNNENRNETKMIKKNLFSIDFGTNGNDNINGNNGDEKEKKGNFRNFVNKEREREKEERRKDEIEKENERRRIEREERRKEQIEREKEYEKRRKERKEEERKRKEEKEEKLRKEKEERIKKDKKEDTENDDIFTKPIKIIYVPKRISGAKPLKSRLYFKRLEKDKNIKIEEFIKLIIKKFYKLYYPSFIYQLKIIRKSKIIKLKLDSLNNIFKLIEIKKLKQYLKIYRDNVLNEKVKEEFLKKNMMKFKKMNQKYNNDIIGKKKEDNNNEDKKENNLISENKEKENKILENKILENKEKENKILEKEKLENKILEDKILENNRSEIKSIKEENENNNDDKNTIENEGNNEVDKNNENEKIDNNNNDSLKQINILKKNNINNEEIKKEDRKIKFNNNLHSPDMEIRGGNKSKKKHIKVKYSKAMTSKTSIGSIKSEGKSNNSLIQTKKMRIKNVVVNPSDYFANILINNNSSLYSNRNNNIHNNNNINTNSIKLINLIDKVESKNLKFKCFKSWKELKNES